MNCISRFAMPIFVFTAFAAIAPQSAVYAEDSADPSHFTYGRLYCTPDGESHFQNVTVELRKMNFAPPASPINAAAIRPPRARSSRGSSRIGAPRICRSVSITPLRRYSFSSRGNGGSEAHFGPLRNFHEPARRLRRST
jgi:hypothetical protein